MEIENTNQPQASSQNPSQNQPLSSEAQPKRSKKIIISLSIIVALFAFGIGGYMWGTRNSNLGNLNPFNSSITPSPTSTIETTLPPTTIIKVPKTVVFMRNGEIWIRDFTTNQEKKISKISRNGTF